MFSRMSVTGIVEKLMRGRLFKIPGCISNELIIVCLMDSNLSLLLLLLLLLK